MVNKMNKKGMTLIEGVVAGAMLSMFLVGMLTCSRMCFELLNKSIDIRNNDSADFTLLETGGGVEKKSVISYEANGEIYYDSNINTYDGTKSGIGHHSSFK